MQKLITVLCLFASCLGARISLRHLPGIIGGQTTTISAHPYQLSLEIDGTHACGASIIGLSWALTSASCINSASTTSVSLRAGSSTRGSGGSVHQAAEITAHHYFNPSTMDYDFALIKVSSPFSFSDNVRAVPLAPQDYKISDGTLAVVTGWGLTAEGGRDSDVLRQVFVPIIADATCSYMYEAKITERMICAGYTGGGKDACQHDNGGPLVADGQLIGVVSWGKGCGRPNYPRVYGRVSEARVWIAYVSGL